MIVLDNFSARPWLCSGLVLDACVVHLKQPQTVASLLCDQANSAS